MNIVILRPGFMFTERRPLTSGFEFLDYASSPVSSKLTADIVAQCALDVAAELKDITPGSMKCEDQPVRWILEEEDILRFMNRK